VQSDGIASRAGSQAEPSRCYKSGRGSGAPGLKFVIEHPATDSLAYIEGRAIGPCQLVDVKATGIVFEKCLYCSLLIAARMSLLPQS
jgi:hypothetical protein